jgi:hypothetical protein
MIAEHTGQMAASGAGRVAGSDVTGQIAKSILSATDMGNPNHESAVTNAANAYQSANSVMTNTSGSFSGLMNSARLEKTLKLRGYSVKAMGDMTPDELRAIRNMKGGATAKSDALYQRGVMVAGNPMFEKDPDAFLDAAIGQKGLFGAEGLGRGWAMGTGVDWAKTKAWIDADPTGARREAYRKGGSALAGIPNVPKYVVSNAAGVAQVAASLGQSPYSYKDTLLGGTAGSNSVSLGTGVFDPTNPFGQTQMLSSGGARQSNAAAAQGLTALGGSSQQAVQSLVQAQAHAERSLGSNPEARMSDAAAKSAESFGASAARLDSASGKLEEAAQALLRFSGVKSASEPTAEPKLDMPTPVEEMKRTFVRGALRKP